MIWGLTEIIPLAKDGFLIDCYLKISKPPGKTFIDLKQSFSGWKLYKFGQSHCHFFDSTFAFLEYFKIYFSNLLVLEKEIFEDNTRNKNSKLFAISGSWLCHSAIYIAELF